MVLKTEWKEIGSRVSQLIARAWLEEEFQGRLIADPRATLEGEGIEIPPDVAVIIDQSIDNWSIGLEGDSVVWRIPLPPKPTDFSEEQLSAWTRGNVTPELTAMMPNCC
ncbi:hypothetical protein NIES2119_27365 [[Phormidium ambiguum] IAM M-71]|uniref:NHLP leader peptide family natural product n=1 Tax=[Phormidium ambiguum] IAM M-71 TaxID=454136 RepID=A0A1U7I6R0_9CYAN|nr:hypothetical protein [Phormidium ambiguum]OKH31950.1 hypothetical protein NIES2119_27365 [Phormidium ambiguum IAM M-71]